MRCTALRCATVAHMERTNVTETSSLPLSTQRLALVPISVDDVDALWPYTSDPELPRMMTWEHHTDKAQTRA